jgi:hypothetical protein
MSILNIVSIVSCGMAIVCLLLYVYQIVTLPRHPAAPAERADAVARHGAVEDMGKLFEALAKLTDSLVKAGPVIGSLVGAMFFLALAALTAGLGGAESSKAAGSNSGSTPSQIGQTIQTDIENKLRIEIDSIQKRIDELQSGEIAKLIVQMQSQQTSFDEKFMDLIQLINSTSASGFLQKIFLNQSEHNSTGSIVISIGAPPRADGGNNGSQACNACCCAASASQPGDACWPDHRSKRAARKCH